MNGWLMGVVAVIYCFVALGFWLEGRSGMALGFLGYALSNLGFIHDFLTKGH